MSAASIAADHSKLVVVSPVVAAQALGQAPPMGPMGANTAPAASIPEGVACGAALARWRASVFAVAAVAGDYSGAPAWAWFEHRHGRYFGVPVVAGLAASSAPAVAASLAASSAAAPAGWFEQRHGRYFGVPVVAGLAASSAAAPAGLAASQAGLNGQRRQLSMFRRREDPPRFRGSHISPQARDACSGKDKED